MVIVACIREEHAEQNYGSRIFKLKDIIMYLWTLSIFPETPWIIG